MLAVVSMVSLSTAAAHGQRGRVSPASEDEDPKGGPEVDPLQRGGLDFGARVGFALPFGDLTEGEHLSDGLSGAIPLSLDLAVRGNKNVAVGLGFDLAPTLTKNCDPGSSCSATDYRLRLEAFFTSREGLALDPWLGVGIGYEWLSLAESTTSVEVTGWDYLLVEIGGEVRAGNQLALGPFVSFSLGEYSSASAGTYSADIADQSLHEWLELGVRGTVNL